MPENNQCSKCKAQFYITDSDLDFYKKISPTFAGETFSIPIPTLCPDCREIRRQLFRNERSLYRRKSDKSGIDIISAYSPDKADCVVYSPDEWWADDWDAMSYGQDFDSSKSFFEQYKELYRKVPKIGLQNSNTENTQYGNYVNTVKDCYMSFNCYFGSEKVHYSYVSYNNKNCMDVTFCEDCEDCYYLVSSTKSTWCKFSTNLHNCNNCNYSSNLVGCNDCIFCFNMRRKQYCIENKQYSHEEYEEKIKEFNFGSITKAKEYWEKFNQIRSNSVVKYANITNCEDCEGDDLVNCKNANNCFSCNDAQDCKYTFRTVHMKSAMDFMGGGAELAYEANNIGYGVGFYFCDYIQYSNNMYYCSQCFNSNDCFGCAGLRHKQYCILNKQYSKEEYEQKVAEIIRNMQKNQEWGEYFPMDLSPFGYNETLARDYFPKSKEEALFYGAKWQDNDYSLRHDGLFYQPEDDIKKYIESEESRADLLSGILECSTTKRPFKVVSQELAFYIEHGLPITTKHFDTRFQERFNLRNPRKLYHRKCMNEGCEVEFETAYAPDRPEKVYCEKCYQEAVI